MTYSFSELRDSLIPANACIHHDFGMSIGPMRAGDAGKAPPPHCGNPAQGGPFRECDGDSS
jgi:hypothetical protein